MNLQLFFINVQNADMNGEKDKYNFINIFIYINIFLIKYILFKLIKNSFLI